MLQKPELSPGLMGPLARMQTLPTFLPCLIQTILKLVVGNQPTYNIRDLKQRELLYPGRSIWQPEVLY